MAAKRGDKNTAPTAITEEGTTSTARCAATQEAAPQTSSNIGPSKHHHPRPVEAISDLAGLARARLPMALALLVIFFSMAGIPPLAGFFGKFLVFTAAVEAGFWWLAVVGLLTSVISAFYYIRIIKIAFFDDLPEEGTFDDAGFTLRAVYGLSALSVLLFIVVLSFVVSWANAAAGVFA